MMFSLVYPTFNRPQFIRQALRILAMQPNDCFEVVISDSCLDPALSSEQICRDSGLAHLTYVRPPHPVGMVENWNHALPFTTGDYICYLTDKMFVLPDALANIERAIESAGRPEVVSWISDAYNPKAFPDYFGDGTYASALSAVEDPYQPFTPADDLNRRGRAPVARGEQSSPDYCRGKIVFGAYRRDLVERIVRRYGALFHNISPDYTSMVLAMTEAHDAIEMSMSCVVSVNTDLSNGMLSDTSDVWALGFLNSLEGGAESILPNLLVPGLYASMHNIVAHDFLTLKRDYGLPFEFDAASWLVYCYEDIYRPSRHWSEPRVEAEQKELLGSFIGSLDPAVGATIRNRIAARGHDG
jgi:hypothetical protein